jgi:hypothetical protein
MGIAGQALGRVIGNAATLPHLLVFLLISHLTVTWRHKFYFKKISVV